MKKILALIILLSVSLLISGCVAGADVPLVKVSPSSYDFGEIKQSGGEVSKTFVVENVGSEPLIVNRLSTSCGCTSAEIDKTEIAPGESASMVVTFDPNVHPDDFGYMRRVVYLQTNDAMRKEIEIDISVTVTK